MDTNKYNGYTNYETWSVALIIDNTQALQEFWIEQAQEQIDYANEHGSLSECWTIEQSIKFALELGLKEHFQDELFNTEKYNNNTNPYVMLAGQLLQASLSEVNWLELAEQYLEIAKEQLAYTASGIK